MDGDDDHERGEKRVQEPPRDLLHPPVSDKAPNEQRCENHPEGNPAPIDRQVRRARYKSSVMVERQMIEQRVDDP